MGSSLFLYNQFSTSFSTRSDVVCVQSYCMCGTICGDSFAVLLGRTTHDKYTRFYALHIEGDTIDFKTKYLQRIMNLQTAFGMGRR